jgi:predicted MFS family arabinose efflux permease
MNVGGSALLGWLGLPLAFILNAHSYLAAIVCLKRMHWAGKTPGAESHPLNLARLLSELRDGLRYLAGQKGLFYPLLLTFGSMVLSSPCSSLLAAIVRRQGGSILQLGLLGGAASLGALLGAVYAGANSEGDPLRTYPLWGLAAAGAVCLFAAGPLGVLGAAGLAGLGFLAFSQAVWNTSRVPALALPGYQARLQALTSMAFTLGAPLGAAWGGAAVDRFGLPSLLAGAGLLALASLIMLFWRGVRVLQ